MPPGEVFPVAQIGFVMFMQVCLVAALASWGSWVARRRGNGLWWRRAARLPWLALVIGLVGMIVGVSMLISTFGAIAKDHPADKATHLAQGISRAMMVSGPLQLLAIACHVGCAILFLVATLRAPREL
jgi:hypothetical protein